MSFLDRESRLLQAIEYGNLPGVKRLMGSGINVHTVLYCSDRRESTTVLGTAAFEGQLDIVKYLVVHGASVNYKDPCFGRIPLHWACISQSEGVVCFLLENRADVNSVDRDNVTPIIYAAMYGSCAIVQILIEHGADPHVFDRLRSSALHYASFHGNASVVTMLIKAGCIPNNPVIFGQGTPLANLIYHRDVKNSELLLEGGYKLDSEEWLHQYKINQSGDLLLELIYKHLRNPSSLKVLARTVIRKRIKGSFLQDKIKLLPVPFLLQKYLLLA